MYYQPQKKRKVAAAAAPTARQKKPVAPPAPSPYALVPEPAPTRERIFEPAPPQQQQDLIFVSVPSYRDPELIGTLEDMFKKAKYPHRIIAGVCQQIHDDKDRAFDLRHTTSAIIRRFSEKNIRLMTLPATDAKGPAWARSEIEKNLLGQDEVFFLGIDSHTAFQPHWDVLVINELLACPADKPMLSCYPQDYERRMTKGAAVRTVNAKLPVCFMKFNAFHDKIGLPQTERFPFKRQPKGPVPSIFISAGFIFTIADVIREAPYEPLPYLFLGEEILMNWKYWKIGVKFFSPSKHIVFHLNDRTYRSLFWENYYLSSNGKKTNVPESVRQERKDQESASLEYVKSILGAEEQLPFWQEVGIDFAKREASKNAIWGVTQNPSQDEVRVKVGP